MRKAALLHLFGHAFLDLVGEVVDVVFGQQHHHPEGELAGCVVRKFLLPEERLRRKLIDGQVIAELATESIDLLANNGADRRVMTGSLDHPRELTASRLLRGLHIDVLGDDGKPMALGILVDPLQLDRDRVTLALLLFGRNPSVTKSRNECALCGRRFDVSLDLLRLHAASSPSVVDNSRAPSIEPLMLASKSTRQKRLPSISVRSSSDSGWP
jgi:hypothetical protein